MNTKHLLFLILTTILFAVSCKDKNDKTKDLITGEWEIIETIIDEDNITQNYQNCLSPYRYHFFDDSVIVRDGIIYDTETQNHTGRNKYYKFECKDDSLFLADNNDVKREYKISKINEDTLILRRDIFVDILTRVNCEEVNNIKKLNIKYTYLNHNESAVNNSFLLEINENKEVYKTLYYDNVNSYYKGLLMDSYYDYFKDLAGYSKLSGIENKNIELSKRGIYHKINIKYEGFENTYLIKGKPDNPGMRAILDELNEIVNNIEYIKIGPGEIVEWQKKIPSFETDFKTTQDKTNGS